MIIIRHMNPVDPSGCGAAIYEVLDGPLQKGEDFAVERLRPLDSNWPPYDPVNAPCPNCGETLWFRWPMNVRQEETIDDFAAASGIPLDTDF